MNETNSLLSKVLSAYLLQSHFIWWTFP